MLNVDERIATLVLHDIRLWRYMDSDISPSHEVSAWRALYGPVMLERALVWSNIGGNVYEWRMRTPGRTWGKISIDYETGLIASIPEELFVKYIEGLS